MPLPKLVSQPPNGDLAGLDQIYEEDSFIIEEELKYSHSLRRSKIPHALPKIENAIFKKTEDLQILLHS